MNWITNFVKPKIQALVSKDIPDDLWIKCPECEQMVFHRNLKDNLNVCTHCEYHMQISSVLRIESLLGSEYKKINIPSPVNQDPLKFKDVKRYIDRIRDNRAHTHLNDAILVAYGAISPGQDVVVAAFDFAFMGGSMGIAVGNGIVAGIQYAIHKGVPFIIVPSSGGARMQEGIFSLMQMPRTVAMVDQLKEAGLPYIVVLSNPTTGGVSASFAMLGDYTIAEPKAIIGFTGARVIKDTIRHNLPDGFQQADYLLKNGMIDCIVSRKILRDFISRIISVMHTYES